uniref:Cytochrome P450 n=1 Tax=Stomoxys calcitrans TaxID=35570 RepID=A0A1I8PKU0_STOCA
MHELYEEMRISDESCQVLEALTLTNLVIHDLEAVQEILLRQFENFSDRSLYSNPRDPLTTSISRSNYRMFKILRKPYIAAFAPAKTRELMASFGHVGREMLKAIDTTRTRDKNIVDVYDLGQRYLTDIIFRITFGLNTNSLQNPNSKARRLGMKAVQEGTRPLFDQVWPTLSKLLLKLNITYHNKESIEYFTEVWEHIMQNKSNNDIETNGFVDGLLETQLGPDQKLSKQQLVDQLFGVFGPGLDNTSAAAAYVLYNLAKHPHIQEKTRQEVKAALARHDNEFTYECLKEMKYTYNVILETMRRDPVGYILPRYSLRHCTIRTSKRTIEIPPRTTIIIPIYSIHHNPDYYPQPEEFRPERFEEDEIAKRPQCTFLTYGYGTRKCLAYQYAQTVLVFQLALLLPHYRFSPCEKTHKQLEFSRKRMFTMSPGGPIYLKVEEI